jgi:hypothetical protein
VWQRLYERERPYHELPEGGGEVLEEEVLVLGVGLHPLVEL